MILSDKTIKAMIKENELCDLTKCQLNDNSIQPASLDITIGNSFSVITDTNLCTDDMSGIIELDVPVKYSEVRAESYLLLPKQFVLATTNEYVKLPNNITAFVEGRSSIGRLGLFIQNAGWVDPGFEGQITLELFNASNWVINLRSGIRIGQLVFAKMDRDAKNPYKGKYQGQVGATGSRIYKDFLNV